MKKTSILLSLMAALMATSTLMAANPAYYYDLNGTNPGSGVANGANYIWNTNDSFWNSATAGDGSGAFTNWMDASSLGLTPGTTAAAQGCWQADFSAGGAGSNYVVTIPATETRDVFYWVSNGDNVTLTGGTIRPQGINTYNAGFGAVNSTLTLSNVTVDVSNCHFVKFIASGGSYSANFLIQSNVNVGYKQYNIGPYATADFGNLLDQNLIFTTNYPGGGQIVCMFFGGYGDNAIIQGSGLLTVPLGGWYAGPFPCLCWNPDGYGNGQGGGFAGRGGKLTINLAGDGHTVTWNGNGDPNNTFCGKPFSLIFDSTTADSPVEFQNGIDLAGYTSPKIKVLTPASSNAVATISGPIVDSVGGGTLTKITQNGYEAAGTLVLSGANTYSGNTIIQEGMLMVTSAHLGAGEFDVYGNAYSNSAFGVKVTSSTVTVPMSGLIMDYAIAGTNTTLEFDYNVVNTNGAIMATNFVVNSTTTINLGGTILPTGVFPLIKYAGSIGGTGFAGLSLGAVPAGYKVALVNNAANQSVDLNVTVQAASIPKIIGATASAGLFSFTATNGAPNSTCAVLSTPNIRSATSGWITNSTKTFSALGTFQFSSLIGSTQQYFRLKQ